MSKRCMGCMELFDDELEVCPECGYIVGSHAEEAIHMEPGTLLRDRYIIGKVLGYGGFGVTYIAWDGKLEQKVAVKEYLPGEFSTRMPGQTCITVFSGDKSEQFRDGMKKFVDEAKRLAKFQNEAGIVRIIDSFEENSTAYIVMEYLKGETLTDFLKREGTVTAEKAIEMLTPIMESLQTVHESGLLHRDIAPDNIFLTETGEVKLIDFGASRYATTSHSKSLTVLVKPGFSPEEQYRSRGDQGPYTDVYSLAATMYRMITGKTPPDAMSRRAKYEQESKDILVPPHKLTKNITQAIDVALLNALNVQTGDRTQNIPEFIKELRSDPPAKRKYGKIKKIDIYMWPTWLKILVPSLLAVVLVFSGLLLTNIINFSKFTEEITIPENIVIVPDVEGIASGDAFKLIEDGKLQPRTAGTVESNYIEAGRIVLQNPIGGSFLSKNSEIMLTVSSGTEVLEAINGIATVPYLIWDTKETAIDKIEKAGLKVGSITEAFDESVETGCVISQSIDNGEQVDEGTSLDLVISLGPAAFELPDVKNLKLEEAEEKLSSLGLRVSVEYGSDDSVEKGCIISQDIPAGNDVRRGDEITIKVSSGKELIEVAGVVGKNKDEASSTLNNQGFKVKSLENYDADVEAGHVISQEPKEGSSQIKGAEIVLIVSKGAQPVSVNLSADNGDSNSVLTVKYKQNYGDLPTPSKSGHEFLGWYTDPSGGSRITSSSIVENLNSHTLFAHWNRIEYKLTVNYNNGIGSETITMHYGDSHRINKPEKTDYYCTKWTCGGSTVKQYSDKNDSSSFDFVFNYESNQTVNAEWERTAYTVVYDYDVPGSPKTVSHQVYNGDPYNHPAFDGPHKDYCMFMDWYTEKNGQGSRVNKTDIYTLHENQTLYAYWRPNDEQNWTPESEVQKLRNPKITAEKWVYTKTTDTSHWEKTGGGTHYYASYPDGFDTGNAYYSKYEKSALSGNEKAGVSKREVSNASFHTYIYWHWNYTLGDPNCTLNNRVVSSHKGEAARANDGKVYYPSHFSAFENTENYGQTDSSGTTAKDVYFCNTNNPPDVSWWWFRFEVYKQDYTDYKWVSDQKVETIESTTEVKEGNGISDVKKYVKYIPV